MHRESRPEAFLVIGEADVEFPPDELPHFQDAGVDDVRDGRPAGGEEADALPAAAHETRSRRLLVQPEAVLGVLLDRAVRRPGRANGLMGIFLFYLILFLDGWVLNWMLMWVFLLRYSISWDIAGAHIHAYTKRARAHTYMHTHTRPYANTHTRPYANTHTHIRKRTHTQTHIHPHEIIYSVILRTTRQPRIL